MAGLKNSDVSPATDGASSSGVIAEYAWKWFDFHAKQRQSNIQFSISVLSATLAAIGFLLISKAEYISIVACSFGLVSCYIFYGLDRRNSFLVKLAERELAKFEENFDKSESEFRIVRAADDKEVFMIKYSLAALLLYSSYGVTFFFAMLASLFHLSWK